MLIHNKNIELLSPAGDFEKLKVAFHFGADAVYVGLQSFSLRANSRNFDHDEFLEAVQYTHFLKKKIYAALNIYLMPDQTEEYIKELKFIASSGCDGLIISDLGAMELAKQYAPEIPIHVSTQANTTNQYAALVYEKLGAHRLVMARELSLKQIRQIHDNTRIELEAFIHGAMCISYSGRCLLSAYMTHPDLGLKKGAKSEQVRSANQGDCVHSCRWEFILKEPSRPDQDYTISEDDQGTYILSSQDICMIDHLEKIVDAGITSLKIEGRMKSILYISSIVRAYRNALNHLSNPDIEFNRDLIEKELNMVSHRKFCTGFYFDHPQDKALITDSQMYHRNVRLAALIVKGGKKNQLKLYNSIKTNDLLELIGPDMKTVPIGKIQLFDENQQLLDIAHHHQQITAIFYDQQGKIIIPQEYDILRMEHQF
ncbi:MAG: U32 family peptidase [Spirochaetes bacterium]|nr:U32 family peptidase [Spirochaetota bacterium]